MRLKTFTLGMHCCYEVDVELDSTSNAESCMSGYRDFDVALVEQLWPSSLSGSPEPELHVQETRRSQGTEEKISSLI
jgi:hypothetical protein